MNEQRHDMVLEQTHPSGAEEWYCPTCGQRMTIAWQTWKKIILEPGDIYAAHSASQGGLRLGPLQITQDSEDSLPSATELFVEERYLVLWLRWLEKVDSDDLWNKEV